jgi:hypothetical protein
VPTPRPIQWHPLFAQLLRPLVESHYHVETGVPVGDAPRLADLLLLQRTSTGALPFRGLWRWLTTWNVLEYKGPSTSARVADLDALAELGLGIHRRLNEQRREQHQTPVGRSQVAWWYLAPHLGRRFLHDAQLLLGTLEPLGQGLWRAHVLERPVFLVSGRVLPVERDSVAAHALTRDVSFVRQTVLPILDQNPELLPMYGGVIVGLHRTLTEEMNAMARRHGQEPIFDVDAVVELIGLRPLLEQIGLKRVVDEVGVKRVVDEVGAKRVVAEVGVRPVIDAIGVEELLARLTPAERKAALRQLQGHKPAPK